jgi:phage tail sheath protein FI
VPLPQQGSPAERNILAYLVHEGGSPLASTLLSGEQGLASAFVQLVYPWARTPGSTNMPQQLESPEGIVAGLLAQNALIAGAYRNAGRRSLGDVFAVEPIMNRQQMLDPVPLPGGSAGQPPKALIERITLLGPTPDGLQLLSDVTTSLDEHYRPANVNRLVSIIVRAARLLGQDTLFETSSELLWSKLREKLSSLLLGFYNAGALRGASPAEAFSVRCDRSTMTQADIDNGRLVAEIVFAAASSIEQITIVLAMDEAGQVSLASTAAPA